MKNNIEQPLRLLVDLESLYKRGYLGGKDPEGKEVEHNGKKVHVNGVAHGVFETVKHLVRTLEAFHAAPYQMILVTGGLNSNAYRLGMYPAYKEGNGDRPPLAIERMNLVKDEVIRQLCNIGATHCTLDHWEADDILAYLAKSLQGRQVIVSTDGDMAQLVGGNVMVYNPGTGEGNANPFGNFPHGYIPLYKALVGDYSDNLKGAKNFGPKSFEDMYAREGDAGLEILAKLVANHMAGLRPSLDDLRDEVEGFKPYQKIIDDAASVVTSWKCANLYPHLINTCRKPLRWRPGMVKPADEYTVPALRKWCQQRCLVDARNFDQMLGWVKDKFADSLFVALDIETSTPAISDEWKARFDKEDKYVDVFGSELTGMGLTFGHNQQYTVYLTHDHVTEHNLTLAQVKAMVDAIPCRIVIQNLGFELAVLWNHWGQQNRDNGYRGFLPDVDDTALMASYVDENAPLGLKQNSKRWLDYEQTDYATVTQGRKMNQLTPEEVFDYGTDDTICTAALYNFYRIIMELEDSWRIYRDIDIDTAYLLAMGFVQGIPVNLDTLKQQEQEDAKTQAEYWSVIEAYLIQHGWPGAVMPEYDGTPAAVKAAFEIVTGKPFDCRFRLIDKLAQYCIDNGAESLGQRILKADKPSLYGLVDAEVRMHWSPAPDFNMDSPKQKVRLLYEIMGLPIRLRNSATENMRAKRGILPRGMYDEIRKPMTLADIEAMLDRYDITDPDRRSAIRDNLGTPSSDDDAIGLALALDLDPEDERAKILQAMLKVSECHTRYKFYYHPYPLMVHWKDGLLHPMFRQNGTVTRRFSGSSPNLQQMSKGEGVRSCIETFSADEVLVSLDESGQELRLMADLSRDENMLSCYVGEYKRDIHAITGTRIAAKTWDRPDLSYEEFRTQFVAEDKGELPTHDAIKVRSLAKTINFGRQYGAEAFTLAVQLRVEEAVGLEYLEAYDNAFPGVAVWKEEVVEFSRSKGYALSKLGARRHLHDLLNHPNKAIAGKAERQGPNFCIQGSGAEMIKKVMCRLWRSDLFERYGVRWYFTVHDEIVVSVPARHAQVVIPILHAMLIEPFADMTVPLASSIDIGHTFGQMIGVGETPDPVRIQAVLKRLGYATPEEIAA